MTAVASPPSFQPLPRWNSSSSGQGGLNPMSAEEVTRMFMPQKSVQRSNSSSSVSSSSSSSTATLTIPMAPSPTNGEGPATNGDQGGWGPRKKPARGLWPSSKAEPVSGISKARPQSLPTAPLGQSAASTMSAIHQPAPILPSQNRIQPQQQQNGGRIETSTNQSDPPAVLALHPLTSTFERKHITVPYFPEVLRIGRQTGAKTVPTPVNGFFDSKVLSRQHAEVWADRNGKIWIRDVKSSNGTFVNGARLSPENRDSEPHELREHDTLELGIDIVSEDQKSIVHHKVSAKVEHAGIYNSGTNVLDLNFGDIDPSSGNSMSMGQQQGSQARGRGGSQGSIASNGRMTGPPSMAGSHTNGLGPQRPMNFWLNPISIEQVVKKLTTELKQAKQQSQDLHRTGDFFSTLLTLEPGEELPKLSSDLPVVDSKTNGVSPTAHVDAISPFSQPPAPPPQQPLPEKPDMARFISSESLPQPNRKGTDIDKPKSVISSPTRSELPNSNIVSLVEALTSAKREIDSQGDRVKQLEVLLRRERKAREGAEERARRLLASHPPKDSRHENGIIEQEALGPQVDGQRQDNHLLNEHTSTSDDQLQATPLALADSPAKSAEELHHDTENVNASTSRLQERLELMVREMDEMKSVMESYKRRAEGAEEERDGLAEMVERIRSNADLLSTTAAHNRHSNCNGGDDDTTIIGLSTTQTGTGTASWGSSSTYPGSVNSSNPSPASQQLNQKLALNGKASSHTERAENKDMRELEQTVSAALMKAKGQRWGGSGGGGDGMMQSAPYVSMVGVVLIGVGIMTWLNGWQKGAER